MDLKLSGLRALIAGSSKGLGFATARLLAMEGVSVALNGRYADRLEVAAEKLEGETGMQVLALVGDVTDPEVPARLVAQVVEKFRGLDLLVTNSAGPPPGKFETFDDATWAKAVDLSLMCHVRLIRAALPYLRQSRAASVLTMTSYTVKQPVPNLVLSNSVRLATIGLTKSLALELGAEGIRFNSILPAWTETERIVELLEDRARTNKTTLEQEGAKQARESVFGRMGHPEEFAKAAVFLLSPAASYITGAMLNVDGGMIKGLL
jgi:3-oxoacyl-[acyl-carrier protein] reductase